LRAHLILSSLAIVSLLIGLWFAPEAAGPRRVTVTFTIPAGANLFARWGFDVLTAGTVSGSFAAPSGGSIGVYVMTQAQHDAFASRHFAGAIAFVQGSYGNYSAPLAGGGRYLLVVVHGAENEGLDQSGSASVRISAVSTWPFVFLFSGSLATVGLAIAGGVLRAKFQKTAGALPAPSGVVYFEPPPPPP